MERVLGSLNKTCTHTQKYKKLRKLGFFSFFILFLFHLSSQLSPRLLPKRNVLIPKIAIIYFCGVHFLDYSQNSFQSNPGEKSTPVYTLYGTGQAIGTLSRAGGSNAVMCYGICLHHLPCVSQTGVCPRRAQLSEITVP